MKTLKIKSVPVLEGLSQLVSVFMKASQYFIFNVLHNKAVKKFKTIGAYTESTDLIFKKTFKKTIHLVTQSFTGLGGQIELILTEMATLMPE